MKKISTSLVMALTVALLAGCFASSDDTDSAQFASSGTGSFNQTVAQSCSGHEGPPCLGWSSTGSMSSPRYGHTATLLLNGRVLVVGGINASGFPVATAEVYNPASGTWSSTGPMTSPRGAHTATLLPNGKVLVAGGASPDFLVTTELYDPALGTWSRSGSMAASRHSHTATLLPNGKVLVSGGEGTFGTAELYTP